MNNHSTLRNLLVIKLTIDLFTVYALYLPSSYNEGNILPQIPTLKYQENWLPQGEAMITTHHALVSACMVVDTIVQ